MNYDLVEGLEIGELKLAFVGRVMQRWVTKDCYLMFEELELLKQFGVIGAIEMTADKENLMVTVHTKRS